MQPKTFSQPKNINVADVADSVNVPEFPETGEQRAYRPHMMITQKTHTPLDLHLPQGKYIPPPTFRKNTDFDLKKVLPGYSRSDRCLTFVSPEAKKQLAKNLVASALKCLGGVVSGVSEQDKSFDQDDYIRSMVQKAKVVHEECLAKHEIYKKQFYVGRSPRKGAKE